MLLVAFAWPVIPAAALHVTMYMLSLDAPFFGGRSRENREFIENQQVIESW
jgi:hypothetical protein